MILWCIKCDPPSHLQPLTYHLRTIDYPFFYDLKMLPYSVGVDTTCHANRWGCSLTPTKPGRPTAGTPNLPDEVDRR